MKHAIDAVAFDLDGTLYPDFRLYIHLIPQALKNARLLMAFRKARRMLRRAGQRAKDFYAEQAALTAGFLGERAELTEERIERLIYRSFELPFKKIKLFPDVPQTLAELRAAGFKLGLLSDFPPRTKLEYLGIDSYWDAVLCSEETGALKPDGVPFTELARKLDTAPERVLYVGNSFRYDIKGAKKAGLKAALIKRSALSTGFSAGPSHRGENIQADFVFSGYRQLRDYMIH